MNIDLQFTTKNGRLPLDYRRVMLSFFKKSLSEIADGKYFAKYYRCPERRNFTFTVNFPQPIFSKSEITLAKNEFRVTFSTVDSNIGYVFISAFIAQIGKKFNAPMGNTYILKNVVQKNEKTVVSDSMLVKMQSPLCLREHSNEGNKDRYISVADNDFESKARDIIVAQLLSEGFSESAVSKITINPVDAKKTVVFHYGTYIECSLGVFAVNGDKSVLNYLLKSGIGSRKSSGFGFPQFIVEG